MKNFFLSLFLSIISISHAQLYLPADTLHNNTDNLTVYFEDRTDQLVDYFRETNKIPRFV